MHNALQTITMIFVGPPSAAGIRLPAGSKSYTVQPFEPFGCTNGWLRRMTGRSSRFWAPTDFEDHVRRCADGQLRGLCALRGLSGSLSREQMIAGLIEGIHDEPRQLVLMDSDLRVACASAGLESNGDRAILLARLGLDESLRRADPIEPPAAADDAPSDLAEETAAATPPVIEPAEIQAPAPVAAAAASKAVASPEQIGQLKALLAADDYNGVWSLATNLTETRPADKSKARVMGWARELLASLEG